MSGAGTGPTKGAKSGTYEIMPKTGMQQTIEPEEVVPPLYKGDERKQHFNHRRIFYCFLLSNVVSFFPSF